jgi:signal transduction histidine kinase
MLLISLMIAVALVASLIALLALIRNPGSRTHRWLFLLIISACIWVVIGNLHSIVDQGIGLWLSRVAFAAAALLAFALVRFSAAVTGVTLKPFTIFFFFAVVALCFLLSSTPWVIEALVVQNDGMLWSVRGPLYPLVIGLILYMVIHGLVLLDHHRRHQTGIRRAQFSIIETGLVLGTLVGVTTNIILPNLTQTTFPSRFAFLAIVILTSFLIYAVAKHRFLDLRVAVARTLAYTVTLVVAALFYFVVIFGVTQFLLADVPADHAMRQLVYAAVAVVVAVTFHSLKLFFDRTTSRLFLHDAYDTKEVLDTISDALVQELDMSALMTRSGKILQRATKARHVEYLLIGSHVPSTERRVIVGRNIAPVDGLVEQFAASASKVVVTDELAEDDALHELLERANIAAVARLETSKELVGYLLLGFKANGAAYTSQDVGLVRIAADELALAIQNALRFEEIESFNETLKKKVADATVQLRESNKKLKELDVVKDEFISMASHQLRTPLTSIKGYLSMVLEGDVGKVPPEQHKLLEEAFLSAQRMVYLIGDFLNVSRIQTGKFVLDPHPTNLTEVVADEIERLRLTIEHRNVKIEYKKPTNVPTLLLDEDKMRQVTMNFIDNAVFYSKPGGRVKIEFQVMPEQLRFTVSDNGIGVPADERDKLFTKFFRASNARRVRPDGTGIGLFLAKKVVTAHGGSVIGNSEEGVGSTFGFSLPLNAAVVTPARQKD